MANRHRQVRPWLGIFSLVVLLLLFLPQTVVVSGTAGTPKSSAAARRTQEHPPRQKIQSRWRRSRSPPLNFHVINLDRDTERWESVVSELTSKGVRPQNIQRIRAVDGKNLSATELENNATTVARTFCTLGMIGCFLSHRSFWEQTASGTEAYRLVLEDDVVVAESFPEKVGEILDEIETRCPETRDGNWDVIFLGALGCVHPEGKYGLNRIAAFMSGGGRTPKQNLEGAPHCHFPRRPLGAHAYLLSKRGARKLLEACSKASGHVDVVAWGMPDLTVVSVHPMLAHQNAASPSTIGAVTEGLETRLPRLVIDDYTGIVFEWVFNAPVLSFGPFVLTMGRSVTYILVGYLVAALLYDKCPWLIAVHSVIFGTMFVLTKATTLPSG